MRRRILLLAVAALIIAGPWVPNLVRGVRTQPGGRAPTITASPNPVPRGPTPGTTIITWNSGQQKPARLRQTRS